MNKIKKLFWIGATVALVGITFFSLTGTVNSKSGYGIGELEEYYLQKERQLTVETREFLKESGYKNCGVMVTCVADRDGSRTYTVAVHHRELEALEVTDRQKLVEEMQGLAFVDELCEFKYEFF